MASGPWRGHLHYNSFLFILESTRKALVFYLWETYGISFSLLSEKIFD